MAKIKDIQGYELRRGQSVVTFWDGKLVLGSIISVDGENVVLDIYKDSESVRTGIKTEKCTITVNSVDCYLQ